MDTDNKDWKKKVGFPINYDSGQSSEDDFDQKDVIMRADRKSAAGALLDDVGDGAEADLLGTTPPRTRIRYKEQLRRRYLYDSDGQSQRVQLRDPLPEHLASPERQQRKRAGKYRNRERDWKQEMGQGNKADSLPSSNPRPELPTLVESCNRFMSLTSRLKCREMGGDRTSEPEVEERRQQEREEDVPENRVIFHKTFSMLINMGNIEKGCRRAISREEQVWQNELKDLIWLELQAKLAGRSLAQQDAYLCAQRNIVPTLVRNIIDYRFVNSKSCRGRSKRLCVIEGSREDLTTDHSDSDQAEYNDEQVWGCLSFNCQPCSDSIGKALREVGTLLDSFFNAVALYPSSKAMTVEHPLVATQLFQNRIKAMCLWYNIAMPMRLKVLAVRRMLRSLRTKVTPRDRFRREESELSGQSETGSRECQVRFECSTNNPTDSSNSDSSRSEGNRGENSDQVDSGSERNGDVTSIPTPEIVISESDQYATTDTSASCESGYHSNYGAGWGNDDVYDMGSLEDLTVLQLLGKCEVSPYREYHREILKTQGVRSCMKFINKVRNSLLYKVHLTFERIDRVNGELSPEEPSVPAEVFDTRDEERGGDAPHDDHTKEAEAYELRRYGCWSQESLAMRLPSYRNHFLLLSSICMEAIHDYLTMRLNTRPENPSCLTVKQLIHELKEGLDIATETREAYVRDIGAALAGHRAGEVVLQELQLVIRTFDTTVETVLKQYLSYLTTMSVTEHMPRSCLESEWSFTARLARRVRCAALLAPNAFTDIACNQLKRIQKQIDDDLEKIEDQIIKNAPKESEVTISDLDRHGIFAICRFTQNVYASEREATLQAAQWARALAARLARAPPPSFQNQRARIFESLMCIRNATVENTEYILCESGRDSTERSMELGDQVSARVRELLLQVYKLGFELHKVLYDFAQAPFKGQEGGRRPLRPTSLQPPRPRAPTGLRRRRPETMIVNESYNPMIHKELQRVVNDSIIARPSSQSSQRRCANMFRAKLVRSESIGEDGEAYDYRLFDQLSNQKQTSIELLLSGERPKVEDERVSPEGQDVPPAVSSGVPGPSAQEEVWAGQVARAVIGFARCWMKFVMERCDRGRGLRPRWASQGLEFLMLACAPCNTKHLTEQEFEELKQLMDKCISHVIGSRPTARPTEQCLASPTPQRCRPRLQSPMSGHCNTATRDVPLPPTPPTEPDPLLSFHDTDSTAHANRVMEALEQLDKARDQRLREIKALGRVKEETVTSYEPKLRQVTFKWQRGLKIGAGTFGKVYTVVNTETGQLLAMKELTIGAGDRRALQRAANELRVLEGVIHPHLVRYYGCEVHREEMLIFMELCVEGSLEALVATSGALPEHTVRRYTKQLLSAVQELHNRNIAHRDIKSGNIFLTNEGHCLKLGDFGCAVKIRASTTAVGELQGCVGTQAYMAPEVFMKSSGHGRAADIWSLGCVVTEMASGKRPFSEYDNSYQIMFVVGMGGRPSIPDTLSPEGADFCTSCLTHDPDQRPRAHQLSMHHFLLVKSDGEDCNCEPAYFIEKKLRDTQF